MSRAPREELDTRRGPVRLARATTDSQSRVVEWVGTREEKPPHATRRTYLALRYVLRVRGERPEHAFRVRALVRVVAVVQHVAQLLELRERLRHGASPESRRRGRQKVPPPAKSGSRSDSAGRSPSALAPRPDPDAARSRRSTTGGVCPPPRCARLEDPRPAPQCATRVASLGSAQTLFTGTEGLRLSHETHVTRWRGTRAGGNQGGNVSR